jgi:8-oxo-dGTP pyrophosphatase MutT (NUDIX family)
MTELKVSERNGPWRVHGARLVYENPWLRIIDHKITHPDGSPGQYGVVRYKNKSVGVLPIDDEGRVRLIGQHRFPFDHYSWELPEGGCPPTEEPLQAARRELEEEADLKAASWLPLVEAELSNSISDEVAICYLAFDLSEGKADPEPSEVLKLRTVTFRELLDEVLSGQIRDSLTVMMALAAHARALKGEFPERISRFILAG